jgi:hypothetical protein
MISTLLAGLIILLSLHAVDSLSPSRRSEPQLFTLPIRPIPRPSNIHPQIVRDQFSKLFGIFKMNISWVAFANGH